MLSTKTRKRRVASYIGAEVVLQPAPEPVLVPEEDEGGTP